MWSGSFSTALQQSADSLGLFSIKQTSKPVPHMPTLEEIHASFEQAHQRQPSIVDDRYALHSSLQEHMPQGCADSMPPEAPLQKVDPGRDSQQDGRCHKQTLPPAQLLPSALSPKSMQRHMLSSDMLAAAPHSTPGVEYKHDQVESHELSPSVTGSGASFDSPHSWTAQLHQRWTDTMAYVQAAQQPFCFFNAQLGQDADPDAFQVSEEEPLHGYAYSPWPQPSVFARAWQQASAIATTTVNQARQPAQLFQAAQRSAARAATLVQRGSVTFTESVQESAGRTVGGLLKRQKPSGASLQVS